MTVGRKAASSGQATLKSGISISLRGTRRLVSFGTELCLPRACVVALAVLHPGDVTDARNAS
jgi:hypothetical protein